MQLEYNCQHHTHCKLWAYWVPPTEGTCCAIVPTHNNMGAGLIFFNLFIYLGASLMAQWVKNLPAMQETQESGFDPWVRKIPWRRKMATYCSILA